jgi:threonine dehydratase
MIPPEWFEEARQRITPHICKTPLEFDVGNRLYLKWENQQITGSFKARGALNKVLALQPWERQRGIVTASAGNHGQGVALAGKLIGSSVTVFASESASRVKLDAIRAYGAELRLVPGGYGEAEQAGLEYARTQEKTWVSAYNDGQVIAGQGTLAREVVSEIHGEELLAWLVPCGGGGLISGIGAALHSDATQGKKNRLIGVQSQASPFLYELFVHGTQAGAVELPSLADGLSGPVEQGSITIPLARKYVDAMVLVSEVEIISAMRYAWQRYHQRIEPSAAVGLAAVLTGRIADRPAVVVITGGNIQAEIHHQLIGV